MLHYDHIILATWPKLCGARGCVCVCTCVCGCECCCMSACMCVVCGVRGYVSVNAVFVCVCTCVWCEYVCVKWACIYLLSQTWGCLTFGDAVHNNINVCVWEPNLNLALLTGDFCSCKYLSFLQFQEKDKAWKKLNKEKEEKQKEEKGKVYIKSESYGSINLAIDV